jgi:hypothetical protein
MLRLFVGFTLILFAATSATGTSADGWRLFDGDRSLLEQLAHPRGLTDQEKERLEDFSPIPQAYDRKRQEKSLLLQQQNVRDVERMMEEKRASLDNVGPTFEIGTFGGGLTGSHLSKACLIGEAGKVYMYDAEKDARAQTTSAVDEREFLKAVYLAKSLGHAKWQPQMIGADFGITQWTMFFDGTRTLLQVTGDYFGALSDPRVEELVKLIDGWCPNAQEIRSQFRPAY